jgi:DNA-binding CsgD family transcriptional regulator
MNKDLSLKLKNEALAVIKPHLSDIEEFAIEYIGCREFHRDGSSIAFCSQTEWYEVVMNKEFQQEMSLHYTQELLTLKRNKFNCIIRTSANAHNPFLQELVKRDMCNSLLIYKIGQDIITMYSFIASKINISALNKFFNKRFYFEEAVNAFQSDLAKLFQKSEYQTLRLPLIPESIMEQILYTTQTARRKVNSDGLTPREIDCAILIVNNATNKDIAQHFKISPRTVETHIINIKKKLCTTSRLGVKEKIKQRLCI